MRPLQTIIMNGLASNANQNSTIIDLRQIVCFSVQCIAGTGKCDGTFQLQVTNDPCLTTFQDYAPVNWTNLGTALTFAQTSTASNQLIPKTDNSYVACRVVFTDGSGGTNTAPITAELAALGL